jgi:hypothetical protein
MSIRTIGQIQEKEAVSTPREIHGVIRKTCFSGFPLSGSVRRAPRDIFRAAIPTKSQIEEAITSKLRPGLTKPPLIVQHDSPNKIAKSRLSIKTNNLADTLSRLLSSILKFANLLKDCLKLMSPPRFPDKRRPAKSLRQSACNFITWLKTDLQKLHTKRKFKETN